jgi:hypothetical protein
MSPIRFFITGLPRSRSAWFANLFTWGDSICYHDALYDDAVNSLCWSNSLRSLQSRLLNGTRGHSDASNLLAWEHFRNWFPDAKWVVVERPLEEVLESSTAIYPNISKERLRAFQAKMEALISGFSPLVVKFDEITPFKCYEIAEYIGVSIGPATRVRMLCDMNVQIHPPILKQRLANLKCQPQVDTKTAA